jgi:uncharacterized protein (DUF952 family)
MGSKSSKPTTTTTTAQLPDYLKKNYESITKAAASAAATPFNPYKGELVAGMNGTQQNAIDAFNNAQGIGDPYFQAGASALDKASGYGDIAMGYAGQAGGIAGQLANTHITPIQWSQAELDKYMNPYQAEVIKATMANIAENNAQQTQGLIGNTISKGAWGGDRAGIAQAAMARQQDLASNATLAGLNAQNYQQAMAQFNVQQGVDLQRQAADAQLLGTAGQMYTGLGSLAGNVGQMQAQAGAAYGNLGTGVSQAAIQQAMGLLQAGTVEQQTAQARDNAQYSEFMRKNNYPMQSLGWLANVYYGLPQTNTNGTSSEYKPAPSMASQLGGAALTGLSVLSDRRAKEDIKGIGQLAGHKLYNFRYKGDPQPRTGFIAQEVEKKVPEAVTTRPDGLKQVNYALAMAAGEADKVTRQKRAMGGGGLGQMDYGAPAADPTQSQFGADDPLERLAAATRKIESSGRYDALGPVTRTGDRGYGAYQVMGANVPSWTKQWLGRSMTPQEYLHDQQAQDDLFRGQGGDYLKKFGMSGALSMWHSGRPNSPNVSDGYTRTPDYVKKGLAAMGETNPADLPRGEQVDSSGAGSEAPNTKFGGLGAFDKPGLLTGDMMSGDTRMSLAQMGAAMMASKSPYFGQALGEGMQAGLGQYSDLQKKRREDAEAQAAIRYRNGIIDIEKQKVGPEIEKTRADTDVARAGLWETQAIPGVGLMRTNRLTGKTYIGAQEVDPATGQPIGPGGPASSPGSAGGAGVGSPPPASAPAAPAAPAVPAAPQVASGYDPTTGSVTDADGQPIMPGTPAAPAAPGGKPVRVADNTDPHQPKEWQPTTELPQALDPEARKWQLGQRMNIPRYQAEAESKQAAQDEAANSADQTQMMLDRMDAAMQQLPAEGWQAQGPGATWRTEVAGNINAITKTLKLPPVFDPSNQAALEETFKDNFKLGSTLARSLGSREAASVVQSAVAANPGPENTRMGYQRIVAGLRQAAQYEKDKAAFYNSYRASYGHLQGADNAFRKANPVERYADRAIVSTIDPRDVQNALRYGPAFKPRFDKIYGSGSLDAVLRNYNLDKEQ